MISDKYECSNYTMYGTANHGISSRTPTYLLLFMAEITYIKNQKLERYMGKVVVMDSFNNGDARFDKVVAGNVIHLLPEPEKALHELERVVKPGGKIIIPTYINMSKGTGTAAVKFITLLGADFKRQFNLDSYKKFFEEKGYTGVRYHVVDGRMPCAIAVITKAK